MKPSSIISAGFLEEATCGGAEDKANTHSHRWLPQTPEQICIERSMILLNMLLYFPARKSSDTFQSYAISSEVSQGFSQGFSTFDPTLFKLGH